jgi:hypothetical protein
MLLQSLRFRTIEEYKNNKSYRLTTMYIIRRVTLSLAYTAGTEIEKRSDIGQLIITIMTSFCRPTTSVKYCNGVAKH